MANDDLAMPTADEQRLLKELNDSGYPFQHTVAKVAEAATGAWSLINTEFPVLAKGRSTHIDILAWCHNRTLMVAECKRVNPAYSDWLFARLPAERALSPRAALFEQILWTTDNLPVTRSIELGGWEPYHVSLEVKTRLGGDAKGGTRALREAITQVQTGANAIVTLLANNRVYWSDVPSMMILPVIFTTAKLHSTNADLTDADLLTGKLQGNPTITEEKWIWLEDNISTELLHDQPSLQQHPGLHNAVRDHHARCVAIVTASAIDAFMKHVGNRLYRFF